MSAVSVTGRCRCQRVLEPRVLRSSVSVTEGGAECQREEGERKVSVEFISRLNV